MDNLEAVLNGLSKNPYAFAVAFILTLIGATPPLYALFKIISRFLHDVWSRSFVRAADLWIDRIKKEAVNAASEPTLADRRMLEVIWASIIPVVSILLFVPMGLVLMTFAPRAELTGHAVDVVGFTFFSVGMLNMLLLIVEHSEHLIFRRFVRMLKRK